MPHPWTLERGAQFQADKSVCFSIWAPRLQRPRVRVLTGAAAGEYPLVVSSATHGLFEASIPNVVAGDDYSIITDDDRALPDPVSRWQPDGVHGPSRIVDPIKFAWTDSEWRGLSLEELVIYELHVGTFTDEGTFAAVIPRLADLKALGVSAIEIMPVAQFPGKRNWGYDGVDLYAVQNSYGGPEELRRLVDAAHAVGLGVVLDVVYNHVGPEGNYLDTFGPYFTEKYKTPWGRALNYDDADSDEVRRFIVDNVRYWIAEYHVDALRLDAVHGIFDFSARHLLEEIASAAHDVGAALNRHVIVIGESDLNDPKLIRSASEYGYGLDAQWSDDFHHAVHALLTREKRGYYADFGEIDAVAEALREPFVFSGQHSAHRRRKHGASSIGMPRKRFIVAIQNHDQVGNRASGDRLAASLTPEQLRLAAALLLLSPYVPLIFMGEEYAETNPFQYFIDHADSDLVRAVRDGRRREFESFGWGDDVADPHAESTLLASRLDWDKAVGGEHAHQLALYRDLLTLRREEPMLRPDGSRHVVLHGADGWISLLREPAADDTPFMRGSPTAVWCAFNCRDEDLEVPVPPPAARAWTLRLSTDGFGYGGPGSTPASIPAAAESDAPRRLLGDAERTICLPAWTAAVYDAFDVSNY
jgi:maltooligosyltrehalose trehalohydrolase